MAVAAVLYFDEESEKKIYRLWQMIFNTGLCTTLLGEGAFPHITLGGFEGVTPEEVAERLRHKSPLWPKSSIQFTSVSTFLNEHGTVYLAPKVTEDMLRWNREFHNIFADWREKALPLYTPELWVPHCTLALNIARAQVFQVMQTTLDTFQPFFVETAAIGFAEFYPLRYRKELDIIL